MNMPLMARGAAVSLVLSLVLALGLMAAAEPAGAQEVKRVLSLSVANPDQTYTPGGEHRLTLVIKIAPGLHVNGHRPDDDALVPTRLELSAPAGITFVDPAYPQAKVKKLAFLDKEAAIYEGEVKITVGFRLAAGLAPGEYPVKLTLSYQGCDDNMCFFPQEEVLELLLKVAS
ncbi:MAG: protein-disulfide reductase DsbD N-terminal domain-containing protein [Deltaproteobacteria bacterium]|nr:protein-disulfide reductase DsbD N-terminal domain-containing protein [Deltaproteobacteria bacterium]